MVHAGQELQGPDGLRLLIVRTGLDRDDDGVLEMEATYRGGGLPPPHIHPRQSERFTVLEGAVRAIIDGEDRRYGTGETFEVPAGVTHQMGGDGPAKVRWEVSPPLRTAEFFERIYGTLARGAEAASEIPAILAEFSEEIRFSPN